MFASIRFQSSVVITILLFAIVASGCRSRKSPALPVPKTTDGFPLQADFYQSETDYKQKNWVSNFVHIKGEDILLPPVGTDTVVTDRRKYHFYVYAHSPNGGEPEPSIKEMLKSKELRIDVLGATPEITFINESSDELPKLENVIKLTFSSHSMDGENSLKPFTIIAWFPKQYGLDERREGREGIVRSPYMARKDVSVYYGDIRTQVQIVSDDEAQASFGPEFAKKFYVGRVKLRNQSPEYSLAVFTTSMRVPVLFYRETQLERSLPKEMARQITNLSSKYYDRKRANHQKDWETKQYEFTSRSRAKYLLEDWRKDGIFEDEGGGSASKRTKNYGKTRVKQAASDNKNLDRLIIERILSTWVWKRSNEPDSKQETPPQNFTEELDKAARSIGTFLSDSNGVWSLGPKWKNQEKSAIASYRDEERKKILGDAYDIVVSEIQNSISNFNQLRTRIGEIRDQSEKLVKNKEICEEIRDLADLTTSGRPKLKLGNLESRIEQIANEDNRLAIKEYYEDILTLVLERLEEDAFLRLLDDYPRKPSVYASSWMPSFFSKTEIERVVSALAKNGLPLEAAERRLNSLTSRLMARYSKPGSPFDQRRPELVNPAGEPWVYSPKPGLQRILLEDGYMWRGYYRPMTFQSVLNSLIFEHERGARNRTAEGFETAARVMGGVLALSNTIGELGKTAVTSSVNVFSTVLVPELRNMIVSDLKKHIRNLGDMAMDTVIVIPPKDTYDRYVFFPRGPIYNFPDEFDPVSPGYIAGIEGLDLFVEAVPLDKGEIVRGGNVDANRLVERALDEGEQTQQGRLAAMAKVQERTRTTELANLVQRIESLLASAPLGEDGSKDASRKGVEARIKAMVEAFQTYYGPDRSGILEHLLVSNQIELANTPPRVGELGPLDLIVGIPSKPMSVTLQDDFTANKNLKFADEFGEEAAPLKEVKKTPHSDAVDLVFISTNDDTVKEKTRRTLSINVDDAGGLNSKIEAEIFLHPPSLHIEDNRETKLGTGAKEHLPRERYLIFASINLMNSSSEGVEISISEFSDGAVTVEKGKRIYSNGSSLLTQEFFIDASLAPDQGLQNVKANILIKSGADKVFTKSLCFDVQPKEEGSDA